MGPLCLLQPLSSFWSAQTLAGSSEGSSDWGSATHIGGLDQVSGL